MYMYCVYIIDHMQKKHAAFVRVVRGPWQQFSKPAHD